jgi:hypothetical protein
MSTQEQLPPNFTKLDGALRSIGYSFEVAVADIIDNSLDAKATRVLVRLLTRSDGHLDLIIADNGTGMDSSTLKEGMRFGSDVSQDLERLGKFGLGLKLASLSQAKAVKVVSLWAGKLSGRAWLEDGIASGFSNTVFSVRECNKLIQEALPDRPLKKSGTMVRWTQLYRVGSGSASPEERAQKLMRRLEDHLSLAFHRFLSGCPAKTSIEIDIFDEEAGQPGVPILLDPLNPFGYAQSGKQGYPSTMMPQGKYKKRFAVFAHIWPPNSTSAEYKLPGGANAKQGFYFYRNNRLIQAGGWNGIREAEPHLSLARVEVDLPPNIDIEVSLDVKKVEIQLPPDMVLSLQNAKSEKGVDFKKYLAAADETYRKRKLTDSELPLIPASGLPAALVRFLQDQMRHEKTSKYRPLKIKWKFLEKDEFFQIDRDSDTLFINKAFRRTILRGAPATPADVPLFKCLLVVALDGALTSERVGAKLRARLELLNAIMVEAVNYEDILS